MDYRVGKRVILPLGTRVWEIPRRTAGEVAGTAGEWRNRQRYRIRDTRFGPDIEITGDFDIVVPLGTVWTTLEEKA